MAVDRDRWARLLFHLIDDCDDGTFRGERLAVDIYTQIHARLTANGRHPWTD